ncbi:MAG: hypothetical protein PWQ73_375 [Petrotoga sp.]|nr:hypothetical protein [Petrotoga sp.]
MKNKYKILLFIIVISIVILIFFLIFKNFFSPPKERMSSSTNIQIIIPNFAFSSRKNVEIQVLDRSSSEYQELIKYKNFYGDIYKITFPDESNESSILPVTVRYRIPKDYYFGDNFVNFALTYITRADPPIVSEFNGEKIVKIEDEYYIEAQTFQITKINYIGLVIKSPEESSGGLKVIKEAPPTLEPDIILIPGTDLNFLGRVMNVPENGYPQSFWSPLFQNRTIWSYNYPLTSTRSQNYNDSFVSFVKRTGINSYIEFEGRRLAQELSRFPNKKFDIIAHGIGGLIARYALESSQTIQNVENLVLISTPNKGSNLANPLFFNLLFGKNTDILSQYFNVEDSTILKITSQISSYLDQINSYYEDLIPDSEFLNKLNSFGIRNDIRYLSVIGNNPEIEEDLSNKYISRLYPEFVQGKGDGIVSVDSANLEGIEKTYYSKKSFYEIYNDPDVLKEIVNFLEESVPSYSVEPFKDDNFVEYTYETEQKNGSTEQNNNTRPSIISLFNLPLQYKENVILLNPTKQGEINEDTMSIIEIGENIYFKSPNAIYNSNLEKKFSAQIVGGLLFNNQYYISTDEGLYVLNENGRIDKISIEMPSKGTEIYYLPNIGFLSVEYVSNNCNVYLNDSLINQGSNFISLKVINGEIYVIFEDKITKLQNKDVVELINTSTIQEVLETQFGEITDFALYNNNYFILFSNYKLVLWNSSKNGLQLIEDGNIGRLKLQIFNDKLFVFGKDYVSYILLKEATFPGFFQRFERHIIDVLIDKNGKGWIVTKNNRIEIITFSL